MNTSRTPVRIGIIRGICQMPAYIAKEKGFFEDQRLDVTLVSVPTAWLLPTQLVKGKLDFAIMPWTRVLKERAEGVLLVMIAGSGIEEAALVIRPDLKITEMAQLEGKKVALPQKGGMKDLTFQGLLRAHNVKREDVHAVHYPSGDAAILSFISKNADAVVTVEPFATLLIELGFGKVLARARDIWPGVPGCSLTTTDEYAARERDVIISMIKALLKAEELCYKHHAEAARLSADYIGISPQIIERALNYNSPCIDVSDKVSSMLEVAELMIELGYVRVVPKDFYDFKLLKEAKR